MLRLSGLSARERPMLVKRHHALADLFRTKRIHELIYANYPANGPTLFSIGQSDSKFPGLASVAPGLSHSLHPDFYRHELSGSLERLQGVSIGAYLVEHPDHHLAQKLGLEEIHGVDGIRLKDSGVSSALDGARLADARASFYEDVTSLFEALEEQESQDGNMQYGVSSPGLSLPPSDPMHVSWEALIECAEKAASRSGRDRSVAHAK